MFAQDVLPEYHVTIATSDWAAMDEEFLNRPQRELDGLDPEPYHPIELSYVVPGQAPIDAEDVLMRLKGASSWLQAIMLDADPKMQFVLAFNEIDPDGRFLGVRKIELDMPRTDSTFLRQRMGLFSLRQAGVPAQCANNAKLYINGDYYGLYTNLERLDKEFLQRQFPDADDGDLWKSGRIIKTNEDSFSWDRLDKLWHETTTVAQLDELADLDASMQEWAAEVVVGDADGYYNGRANFYLYDHPTRGFIWLANDLDTTLDSDFLATTASPMFPTCSGRWERDWMHYLMVINDPAGAERYVDALRAARAAYEVPRMQARVLQWSAQIEDAAAEDPHKPFDMASHEYALTTMHDYVAPRAEYIDAWLACRDDGGIDTDGDGFDFCHECNDLDESLYPGAVELCNGLDDNCDGAIDNLADGSACE